MRNINTAVLFAFLVLTMKMVSAQEHVQFRSLDHNLSPSGVLLDAILFVPPGDERRPAVVFLHGCGGMFTQGNLKARERSWAQQLKALGYVVLVVDSFTPRGVKDTCSPGTFDMNVFNARPYDAYAALEWLRAQSFADAERVGVIGWSEGGGAVLFAIREGTFPRALGFKAAIAFYPGSCNTQRLGGKWRTTTPLMVLIGADDEWTPAAPCYAALEGQTQPELIFKVYPGAYHAFDWPNLPVTRFPQYQTFGGGIPITGTNPAAREDALERVPAFLQRYLSVR